MFNFCTKWYNTRGTLAHFFSFVRLRTSKSLLSQRRSLSIQNFYSFINTHTHSTHRSITSSSCPLFLHRCSLPLPRASSLPCVRPRASLPEKSSLIVKAAAEAKPDPGSDPKGLGNALPMEMDIDAIMKLLPHRYPFLLVDRILEIEQGSYAIGVKNVTINDNFFSRAFSSKANHAWSFDGRRWRVGGLIMLEGGGEGML